jgi:hypothetical protein
MLGGVLVVYAFGIAGLAMVTGMSLVEGGLTLVHLSS